MSKSILKEKQEEVRKAYLESVGTISNIRETFLNCEYSMSILKEYPKQGVMAGVFIEDDEIHFIRCEDMHRNNRKEIVVKYDVIQDCPEMQKCIMCRECKEFLNVEVEITDIEFLNM